MPVYEYQCTNCGQIEEALQKISDDPLTICPHCKGTLKKLISHSSFHLKGSGWYVTDYGGSKKPGTETNSSAGAGKEPAAPKKASKAAADKKS